MDSHETSTATVKEFERSLETVLMSAFARGISLEGTWKVELDSPNLPDWSIQITKLSPESPDYEPEFIEE